MRRLLKIGTWELWLLTVIPYPEMRLYKIAPPETTARLRRRLLRRIKRRRPEIPGSVATTNGHES